VIYIDTSVLLAQLWAEDTRPDLDLWSNELIASRLLVYETWNRIHSRGLSGSHGSAAQELLSRINMLELAPDVLARAAEPFPIAVRTVDALHLSSVVFLIERHQQVELATYDARMAEAARRMRINLHTL
jgi:predicted nucleic acid-binding protein